VLGYNQLINHVGIHGQRRLTEALNNDSLVRQKENPTESSSKSEESADRDRVSRGLRWVCQVGRQNATGSLSRSDHDRCLCHDGPENATYRAVAFSSSEPEFEREKDKPRVAGQLNMY
ncbi:hypothetical protein Taro_000343, partial [Colocasia esculenta]|nr:hypothetical protein [Colocasia esculenta]